MERVYKISRALHQRGHDVTIYTSDFALDHGYLNSLEGVKTHLFHSVLNLPGIHITPGLIPAAARNLKYFDIIHLHVHRSFQNIVLHHYASKYNIPFIIDAHGSTPKLGKRRIKQLYDLLFGNRINRDCSKFIADGDLGVKQYRELGIPPEKIVLIPAAFPVEDFANLPPRGQFRARYNIQEKHVVLFLGRLHWIKGIDFLVQAFRELYNRRDDTILAIVGADDGYQAALEALVKRLQLTQKILFTGFLGGTDKLAALVDADVFVQTSRYEHHAWAPFEAVLCGTPIIVSSHTGAGEEVKKLDAGYTVKFDDSIDIAETINRILEAPSEAIAKTRQAAAYIREKLSLHQKVEEYERAYLDCIVKKHR